MPRPRKYTPGEQITKVTDAVDAILVGRYLYVNGRPQHPGWMQNWSVRQLDVACRSRHVRIAVLNETHPDNFKEVA